MNANSIDQFALARKVAEDYLRGKSINTLTKELQTLGYSENDARRFVVDATTEIRKLKKIQSRNRMIRGLIICVVGLFLTFGSGVAVIFYGAIIWGGIDFVVGFFGWLSDPTV
jgi:hypothetical protein